MSQRTRLYKGLRKRMAREAGYLTGRAWLNTTQAPLGYRFARAIELIPGVLITGALVIVALFAVVVAFVNQWI